MKWTISVRPETDLALRTHLAAMGAKKGDLSKFVEETVAWKLAELNVRAAQEHNRGRDSGKLEDVIEQALAEVRAERFAGK